MAVCVAVRPAAGQAASKIVRRFTPGRVVKVVAPVYRDYEYNHNKIQPGSIARIEGPEAFDTSLVRLVNNHLATFSVRRTSTLQVATKEEEAEFLRETERAAKAMELKALKYYTSGFDPEVFALRADGSVLPAFAFLPRKDEANENGCLKDGTGYRLSMFWDGFQAEFCGRGGYSCHQGVADAIQQGLRRILEEARRVDPQAALSSQCVLEVPEEVMLAAADEHVALGCAPSLNAYGEQRHLDGLDPRTLPLRFAGFHVHLGIKTSGKDANAIVKGLDKTVGVMSVSLLRGLEDERRRQFYGLAGEYRLPAHGLEWRVLSSAVLNHPLYVHLIFDLSRMIAYYANQGVLNMIWDCTEEEATQVINNLDVRGAETILARNQNALLKMLNACYLSSAGQGRVRSAMQLILEGGATYLPTDIHLNWGLDGSWKPISAGVDCSVQTMKIR